jgi:hypothetical protein
MCIRTRCNCSQIYSPQSKYLVVFYEMFTVHFHKIENNDIQQIHFNTFIRYTNTPTCFGPSGPSSGSYTL